MKDHDILEAHKNKIGMLNVEKTNFLEKIRFLKSKHYSFLEKNDTFTQEIKNNKPSSFVNEIFHSRTKVLSEILDKYKTHGDKRGSEYIETPSNDKIVFVKGNDETSNKIKSHKKSSLCTHYKKTGHSPFKWYTRFLERFEIPMNKHMCDFNSLKNNILNNGKWNKTN